MAGIYLHIPFCKKACHYCNFHFSTSLKSKPALLEALLLELNLQKEYLNGAPLESIYLGGGTPSILDISELQRLFNAIAQLHPILSDAEITLEANPDDLTKAKIAEIKAYTPVNRFSIGIQSFREADLLWMNRAHNPDQARQSIEWTQEAGFNNLTIDLIFGTPTLTDANWTDNLRIAHNYHIPHLSCYGLTIESGTALGNWVKNGKVPPLDEEKSARQFQILQSLSENAGYEQYEISNFSLPGHYARHNSNYWLGKPYLGIGPSAHSYNGHTRQWNLANNALYIQAIKEGHIPAEMEIISPTQQYNEYIMTRLRTRWGVNPEELDQIGPPYRHHFESLIPDMCLKGWVEKHLQVYRLTPKGKILADYISSELFYINP